MKIADVELLLVKKN